MKNFNISIPLPVFRVPTNTIQEDSNPLNIYQVPNPGINPIILSAVVDWDANYQYDSEECGWAWQDWGFWTIDTRTPDRAYLGM